MLQTIEIKKMKIEEAKQKIILKEKLLKESEKKKRIKKFSEVGRIAFKADIDQIDKNMLLGAFLEISERVKKGEGLENWKKKAQEFFEVNDEKQSAFSITFTDSPNNDIKQIFKGLGFKWNRIRKEFYGYCDLKTLEEKLINTSASINRL